MTSGALEEERDFLLRSLEDLEAERAAGDMDEADYLELRREYTARAAAVLRRIESPAPVAPAPVAAAPVGAAPVAPVVVADTPEAGPRGWTRRRWVTVGVVAVAVAGGLVAAIAASTGSRPPSGIATGGAVGVEREALLLSDAQAASTAGNPVKALEDYEAVLRTDPNQVVALTNEGWILVQSSAPALLTQGIGLLGRAEHIEPDYPPAHIYRGIGYLSEDDYAAAIPELQWYLGHDPSPALVPRVRTALATAQAKVAG